MRVDVLPRFSERLVLKTWCGGLAASTAERRTTIEGELGASIEAEAIWVHIDLATRRPARFSPEFMAVYGESAAAGQRPRTKLRHPSEPPAEAVRSAWRFSAADMDFAGHVNNAVYWRVLEDVVGPDALRESGATLEAEYRAGTVAGLATVARSGSMLWVLDADGTVAASLAAAPAA